MVVWKKHRYLDEFMGKNLIELPEIEKSEWDKLCQPRENNATTRTNEFEALNINIWDYLCIPFGLEII